MNFWYDDISEKQEIILLCFYISLRVQILGFSSNNWISSHRICAKLQANILQLTSVYQFLWLFSLFTYLSPIFLNWPFKSSPNLHYLSFTHLTKSLIFVVCWLYSSHCSLFMLSLKFIHIWPQLLANLKLNIFIIFAELFCDLGNNNVSGLITQVKSKI